jgi:hypothetical protein
MCDFALKIINTHRIMGHDAEHSVFALFGFSERLAIISSDLHHQGSTDESMAPTIVPRWHSYALKQI